MAEEWYNWSDDSLEGDEILSTMRLTRPPVGLLDVHGDPLGVLLALLRMPTVGVLAQAHRRFCKGGEGGGFQLPFLRRFRSPLRVRRSMGGGTFGNGDVKGLRRAVALVTKAQELFRDEQGCIVIHAESGLHDIQNSVSDGGFRGITERRQEQCKQVRVGRLLWRL